MIFLERFKSWFKSMISIKWFKSNNPAYLIWNSKLYNRLQGNHIDCNTKPYINQGGGLMHQLGM